MSSPQSKATQSLVYSRQEYATKQFWDSRYKQKQSYFDWYAQFPQLKDTFEKEYSLQHSHSILMLGCGNSKLSEQMYEAGYHNIVNVDISPAVIDQMSKISQQKGHHDMKWLVMDATDMNTIGDHEFDVVLDKGTLDALISGKNMDICDKMLRESMRVLKKDGQFILITYGSPEGRKKLFESSLGLTKYDYYFTQVDLSSMSTLINLMRSNLGNKPLSAITKDTEVMKKSLMEFNLIKVLRRQRKNEKKYIIWSNFTTNPTLQNDKQQLNSEQKQKEADQINPKPPKTQQLTAEQKPKQQVSYSPKKQSYCYVYSIKRKFAWDLEEVCAKIEQPTAALDKITSTVVISGDQSLQPIGIYSGQCGEHINKAIQYLKLTSVSNNPIIIYPTYEDFIGGKEQAKINLKYGQHNVIPILNKSIYEVEIKLPSNALKEVWEKMEKVCRELVENGGLDAHPSPKNYAYIGIIMQRLQSKIKLSQFLRIHWYPTFKIISFENNTAKCQISTSPTYDPQYCIKTIHQTLMSFKPSIQTLQKGYLHFCDPRFLTLMNFCALNYYDGQGLKLIVEEFADKSNQQYTCQVPTIYLKKQKMAHMLARIFSAL